MGKPVTRFFGLIARHIRERYGLQISAKALLVKGHGFTAVSVEDQVRVISFIRCTPFD